MPQLLVSNDLVDLGQDLFHCLDVDTSLGNVFGLAVFLVNLLEAACFTLRQQNCLLRVSLSVIHNLNTFASGFRNQIVLVTFGFIDHLLLIFASTDHIFKGFFNLIWWMHILEFDVHNGDSRVVAFQDFL